VHLTVSDTGCGMDRDTVARMFEPYFSTKTGGRGLGLATVFGIIKNHNGWIAVDTEPKRGTSMHIYLPLVAKAATRPGKTNAILSAKRGNEKILVIDDEGVVTNLCRATLGKMGYRVLIANTGDKASRQLDRHPDCSLVVLDLVMPPPGGKAIFEAIRKNHPDVGVLITSGYDKPGYIEKLLKAGVHGFLAKPFTPEDLSAKIRKILDA
ncbi:MAG: response regulator, partial [Planctomycetota bacterium]